MGKSWRRNGLKLHGRLLTLRYRRIGVVGVAPDAEIYTIRVFDDDGSFAYGRHCNLWKVVFCSMFLNFVFHWQALRFSPQSKSVRKKVLILSQ